MEARWIIFFSGFKSIPSALPPFPLLLPLPFPCRKVAPSNPSMASGSAKNGLRDETPAGNTFYV